jgi:hypothetical protein
MWRAIFFLVIAAAIGCVDPTMSKSIGITTRLVQLVPSDGLWNSPPAWVTACEWEALDGLDHDLDIWVLARVKGALPAWPPLYSVGADKTRVRLLYKIDWAHGSGELTTDTDARPDSGGYQASPWSVLGRAEVPAPGMRRRVKSRRVRLSLAGTTPYNVEASCSIGVASWWDQKFLTNPSTWLSAVADPGTGVSALFQATAYVPVNATEFMMSGDTSLGLTAYGLVGGFVMSSFNASEATEWTPLDPDWNRIAVTQAIGSTSPGCVISFR